MIRCITIDDEPLALKQIVAYIKKTPFLSLVKSCDSAFEALDVLNTEPVDLMFVDINMSDLNGMEFVKSLDNKPQVIFTTAYSEYAIDGFKVDALDYLLKPIGYPDFLKAVNKAQQWFSMINSPETEHIKTDKDFLFIKSEYKIVRIKFDEIKYIEGMREYVRIFTENSKPVMSLLSMKSLEAQLPANKFMRVHRSFMVNLEKITTIERHRIIFDRDVYIPVSEQYKEKFQKYIDENFA